MAKEDVSFTAMGPMVVASETGPAKSDRACLAVGVFGSTPWRAGCGRHHH
jgi:hypothetical protein